MPAFHFQILEKYVKVIDGTSDVLAKKLDSLIGNEVEIFKLVNLYALDTSCGKCKFSNF
jgi:hypothetical protein